MKQALAIKESDSKEKFLVLGNVHIDKHDVFPVKKLKVWEKNPRIFKDPRSQEELTKSINRAGILEPLKAFIKDGEILIFDGGRRFTSALELKFTHVPLHIYRKLDEKRALLLASMFNISPRRMAPFDEGRSFLELLEYFDLNIIAEVTGCTEEFILERVAFFRLPKEVKEIFEKDGLTLEDLRTIITCPKETRVKMACSISDKRQKARENKKTPSKAELTAFVVEELRKISKQKEKDLRVMSKQEGTRSLLPKKVAALSGHTPSSGNKKRKGRRTVTTPFEVHLRNLNSLAKRMMRCLENIKDLPDEDINRENIERLVAEEKFIIGLFDSTRVVTDEVTGGLENLLQRLENLGHEVL